MIAHIYRGLPGCGKSTAARALQEKMLSQGMLFESVARDLIRASLGLVGGKTTKEQESVVTEIQEQRIRAALRAGRGVLVDDTNILQSVVDRLEKLVIDKGGVVVIHDFRHIPVEVCIERDAQRTGTAHVGADVIRRMAEFI